MKDVKRFIFLIGAKPLSSLERKRPITIKCHFFHIRLTKIPKLSTT